MNSILNDVMGPIMRGPSSSHTAGSHHIGRMAQALLGERSVAARFTFDSNGSYARTFRQQGVDKAFATALLGWPLTDPRFLNALELAPQNGLQLSFDDELLPGADHPNTVRMELEGEGGARLTVVAKSTGGGGFSITAVNGHRVTIDGRYHIVLAGTSGMTLEQLRAYLSTDAPPVYQDATTSPEDASALLQWSLTDALPPASIDALRGDATVDYVLTAPPVYRVPRGPVLFQSAEEMVQVASAPMVAGRSSSAIRNRFTRHLA